MCTLNQRICSTARAALPIWWHISETKTSVAYFQIHKSQMMTLNRHDGLWEGLSGEATMFNFPTDYFTYPVLVGGLGGTAVQRTWEGDAMRLTTFAIEFKEVWLIEKAAMISDRHQ